MSFDDLTEKEELEMACAADKIEESLLNTYNEDQEKLSEVKPDNCINCDDGAARLEGKSSFTLSYKKGDLFTCPKTDSLAHCVSKDLRMGKGIAVLFKEKFGGISELKQQANRVGDIAILKRDDRYIYYLITKPRYNNKPTYRDLETTLRGMKHHCVKNGVKTLSMPKIGCGLDKLLWSQVEAILKKVFGDTDIAISVYTI